MKGYEEAWIYTRDDVYYFNEDQEKEFLEFLKSNPNSILSIQITQTMAKEEFDRKYAE